MISMLHKKLAAVNKYTRPVSDIDKPLQLELGFGLVQLLEFDELNQVITTYGWMRQVIDYTNARLYHLVYSKTLGLSSQH